MQLRARLVESHELASDAVRKSADRTVLWDAVTLAGILLFAYVTHAPVVTHGLPWADAAMFIERGTAEDPALPQLHKNSGDYAYRSGQYDEALDAYQRATRLNPALGDDVFFKIGNIRYRRRETAEAVICWERALELEPANAIIRSNLDAVRRAG